MISRALICELSLVLVHQMSLWNDYKDVQSPLPFRNKQTKKSSLGPPFISYPFLNQKAAFPNPVFFPF